MPAPIIFDPLDMVKNAASNILAAIPISTYITFSVAIGLALIGMFYVNSLIASANNAARGDLAFFGDEKWENGKLKRYYHENGKSRKMYNEDGTLRREYANARKKHERDVARIKKFEKMSDDFFGALPKPVRKVVEEGFW